MLKKNLFLIFNFFLVFTGYAVNFENNCIPTDNSYVLNIKAYDFGPATDSVVLNIGKTVFSNVINKDDFTVDILIFSSKQIGMNNGLVKSQKKIKNAYLSDENGNKSSEVIGNFIKIEFDIHPSDEYVTPFVSKSFYSDDTLYGYKIQNHRLGINIEKRAGIICKDIAPFNIDKYRYKNYLNDDKSDFEYIEFNYASWKPENLNKNKIPLIIFFHGIGESGTDIYKPLLEIKSSALIQKKIQSYFADGAAVLIPQCPTGWLEITELDPFGNRLWVPVDINGTIDKVTMPVVKFLSKIFTEEIEPVERDNTPVSYYTLAIKDLIDNYIKNNPDIDISRIYVGGCSAGGYMSLNMLIQYPSFFAAGFPVCAAYPYSRINYKQIESLKNIPLWFVVSKNDEVINPEKCTYPIVKKLIDLNAKDVNYTYFDNVKDSSGLFFNSETNDEENKKEPYLYNGHDSWIYLFNDEVSNNDLSLFKWLASQSNSN